MRLWNGRATRANMLSSSLITERMTNKPSSVIASLSTAKKCSRPERGPGKQRPITCAPNGSCRPGRGTGRARATHGRRTPPVARHERLHSGAVLMHPAQTPVVWPAHPHSRVAVQVPDPGLSHFLCKRWMLLNVPSHTRGWPARGSGSKHQRIVVLFSGLSLSGKKVKKEMPGYSQQKTFLKESIWESVAIIRLRACFVMRCGSPVWQKEQDRRSFVRVRMLSFLRGATRFLTGLTTQSYIAASLND